MHLQRFAVALAAGAMLFAGSTQYSSAEVSQVRIATGYTITALPFMIMAHDHLLEKRAKAAGLGDIKVTWGKFAGGNSMNDALLSGTLDFATGGMPPLAILWSKTHGHVKGVCAASEFPLYLNTRDPHVKTIKDFTSKDRIAVSAVKVSIMAITLEMAAAQAFGEANYAKLDPLTMSLSVPDGSAALIAGGIPAQFGSPPLSFEELKHPGIHNVLTSYQVMGGHHTHTLVWTTTKFHDENPKTYAAFVAAMQDAVDLINKNKTAAAKIYLEQTHSSEPLSKIVALLNNPEIHYTTTPHNTMKFVNFMYKTGTIKMKPSSWKDLWFPNVYGKAGS